MTPSAIVEQAARMGVRLAVRDGHIIANPKGRASAELAALVRAHKDALFTYLRDEQERDEQERQTDEALKLLQRLKSYVLPAGRMPVARVIVQRLEPLLAAPDFGPADALASLRATERELIALGAVPDPALAEAITTVEAVFPDARLVEPRSMQEPKEPKSRRGQRARTSTIGRRCSRRG